MKPRETQDRPGPDRPDQGFLEQSAPGRLSGKGQAPWCPGTRPRANPGQADSAADGLEPSLGHRCGCGANAPARGEALWSPSRF